MSEKTPMERLKLLEISRPDVAIPVMAELERLERELAEARADVAAFVELINCTTSGGRLEMLPGKTLNKESAIRIHSALRHAAGRSTMCKCASFVLTKTECHWLPLSDSHKNIIAQANGYLEV